MKKTLRHIALFAAAAAALASCTKYDEPEVINEGTLKRVTINTGKPASDAQDGTRTELRGTTPYWLPTDQIGVTTLEGSHVAFKNNASEAMESTTFTGAIRVTGGQTLYAYYPYSLLGISGSTVKINLPATQYPSATSFDSKADILVGEPQDYNDAEVSMRFARVTGVLKVVINDDAGLGVSNQSVNELSVTAEKALAGQIDLDLSEIKVSGDDDQEKTVQAVYTSATTYTIGSGATYLSVAPQTLSADSKLTVKFSTPGKVVSKEITVPESGIKIESGKITTLNISLKGAVVTDPSPVIDLSANGTANCYVVNKSGQTYRFRANVMGNGATTTGITPKPLAPAKAQLLASRPIAWSYKSQSSDGSDPNMNLMIDRNSVQLKDIDGVPYVEFKTNGNLSAGNAQIAVYDNDKNIIWSWHMWCTPDYELGQGDVTLTANANCNGVVMMDRNLGSPVNGSEFNDPNLQAKHGIQLRNKTAYAAASMVYQFGRKDPIFLTNAGDWGNGNYQDADGNILKLNRRQVETAPGSESYRNLDLTLTSATAPDVETAIAISIANPLSHLHRFNDDYNNSWACAGLNTNLGYLWGNPDNDVAATAGVKTIYDPCPVGYRVPGANAFSFWTQSGSEMEAIYHYSHLERYNFDQSKVGVTVSGSSITFDCNSSDQGNYFGGYFFYTNSILQDGQTDADRTDHTTLYFPSMGVIAHDGEKRLSTSNGYAELMMMTNSEADAETRSIRNAAHNRIAYMTRGGTVYFNFKNAASSFYGWPSSACAVRCIKE